MPDVPCHCGECGPDEVYTCADCGRIVPWCVGSDDERPESCDDCWAAREAAMTG